MSHSVPVDNFQWWSANRDKIYKVVLESQKAENSCYIGIIIIIIIINIIIIFTEHSLLASKVHVHVHYEEAP